MQHTKKGIATTVLAVLIISVVIGVVMLTVFTGIAQAIGGAGVNNAFVDLCHFNMKLKDTLSPGTKWTAPNILCHSQKITINANAWKKCDPGGLYDLKKKADRRLCAAMQAVQLAKTCFDMYGSGRYTLDVSEVGLYPCFKFEIKQLGAATIDERYFTHAMRVLGTDTGYCANNGNGKPTYFNNNDCDGDLLSDGGCGNCGNADNVDWHGDMKSKELREKDLKEQKAGLENARDTMIETINLIDTGKDYTKQIISIKTSAPLLTNALGSISELSDVLNNITEIINKITDWTGEAAKAALKAKLNVLLILINAEIHTLDAALKAGSLNMLCFYERVSADDAVTVNKAECATK